MVSGRPNTTTYEVGLRTTTTTSPATTTTTTKPGEDESSYWKQIAEEYIEKLQYVREEFKEYRDGSQELETELEAQLEQYERRVSKVEFLRR